MQVLTIIVQNTVAYRDLGVATSGVTFFRTLGGAFGAAVFGSLYSNFLSARLPEAIASTGGAVTPANVSPPSVLHKLPADVIQPVIHAYSESIGLVFLWAAPVAILGLGLALMIPQIELRGTMKKDASDLGEGFGMPEARSNEDRLASRIARLVYADDRNAVLEMLEDADLAIDEGRVWALAQVYGRVRANQPAALRPIAHARRVPSILLQPAFQELLDRGYLDGSLDQLGVTALGTETMHTLGEHFRRWIIERLEDVSEADAPAVDAAIERIAQRLLVETAVSAEPAELAEPAPVVRR